MVLNICFPYSQVPIRFLLIKNVENAIVEGNQSFYSYFRISRPYILRWLGVQCRIRSNKHSINSSSRKIWRFPVILHEGCQNFEIIGSISLRVIEPWDFTHIYITLYIPQTKTLRRLKPGRLAVVKTLCILNDW